MLATSLDIRGFKACEDCSVPLQPMSVVVGANGVGKTTVLQAMACSGSSPSRACPTTAKKKRAPATTGFVPPVVERVAEERGLPVKLDGRKLTTLGKATPEAYLDDEGAERAGASALTGKAMAAAKLAADLDVIAERCPVSFAPFLDSLREVASSWASASAE
jgi:energy-coupling factor transporter ATP-binding protein EcfA2